MHFTRESGIYISKSQILSNHSLQKKEIIIFPTFKWLCVFRQSFQKHLEMFWFHVHIMRQTEVVITGSESSTAKRSVIGVSVKGPRRWPL